MDSSLKKIVMAGVHYLRTIGELTVSTVAFWRRWGQPAQSVRADVVNRATAIAGAEATAEGLGPGDTLRDVYKPYGLGGFGTVGGPLDTEEATVYTKIRITGEGGGTAYKTVSVVVPWDTTIDALLGIMDDAAENVAADYGAAEWARIEGSFYAY